MSQPRAAQQSRDTLELTVAHTAMTAPLLLPLLLPLLCASASHAQQRPDADVKHYFIASVEIGWDYIYLDDTKPPATQK